MAASSAHPSFPTRPYTSTLGKLPDRTGGVAPFGSSTTQAHREAQRLERERERAERERIEREGQNQLAELTEEQREEINEAVSVLPFGIYLTLHTIPFHSIPEQCSRFAKQGGLGGFNTESSLMVCEMGIQFGLFDLDKDKRIDYHELKVAMKALGFDLPKSEILSILQTHGVPASSSSSAAATTSAGGADKAPSRPTRLLLSLASFQAIMSQRILARDPRDEILRAFELFDEGAKGKITLQDLRRVARELGEGLEEEELVAMIEEFDLDGDGAISREEFVDICLQ